MNFLSISESQPLISGYSEGTGPIFLSQLECSGQEQSLLDCSSDLPVGLHQCDHTADVALQCLGMHFTAYIIVFICVSF